MEWVLAFSAVLCSWAMLRAIGSERQKRLMDIDRTDDTEAAPSNPPQPPKA